MGSSAKASKMTPSPSIERTSQGRRQCATPLSRVGLLMAFGSQANDARSVALVFHRAALACAIGWIAASWHQVVRAAPPPARTAQVLVPAPSTRMDREGIQAACSSQPPEARCNPETTQAWMVRGAVSPQAPLYLIDSQGPRLLQWDVSSRSIQASWDFSSYPHTKASNDAVMSIHPALYPVGQDAQAVAITARSSQMYSGGGAWFEVADFLVLDNKLAGEALTVLYAAVPFSCEQMIRACFSPEDYDEKMPNCHDYYSGGLRITFPLTSAPVERSWRFTWMQDGTATRFSVPYRATETAPWPVSFCGGN